MRPAQPIQIALAANTAHLRLVMVAITSILEKASRPVTVHFLSDGFTDGAKDILETACGQYSGTRLIHHEVSHLLPDGFENPDWHRVIFARLHLPNLAEGRVLYLDNDTMNFSDIGPLFDMDLNGKPIAAVRDFGQLDWLVKRNMLPTRLGDMIDMMNPYPLHDYFNSGIMLLNCAAIKSDDGLLSRMLDIDSAQSLHLPDQDHLNMIFKGKVHFLDPVWNSFYGRPR